MTTTMTTVQDDDDAVHAGVESCSDAWGEANVCAFVSHRGTWREGEGGGQRLLGNRESVQHCGVNSRCEAVDHVLLSHLQSDDPRFICSSLGR